MKTYLLQGQWLGVAKVLCILRHHSIQLMAYSWARPAILVAGKGRGGMFLFLLFLKSRIAQSVVRIAQDCSSCTALQLGTWLYLNSWQFSLRCDFPAHKYFTAYGNGIWCESLCCSSA